jgi:flagellar FliL protein
MPPPANRSETSPAPDDAAVANPAAAANAAGGAPGGFKAWLPVIVMVVLMPALAYAMTTFVLIPKLQKGLGASGGVAVADTGGAKPKKEAPGAKTESVPMNKLLVNVAGTMGARYLLVSLSVVGSGTDFKAQMDAHDAQLRDMAQSALSTKTLADLEKPGIRNMIRNELLTGFNNILGDGTVQEIYFPEFAIQ